VASLRKWFRQLADKHGEGKIAELLQQKNRGIRIEDPWPEIQRFVENRLVRIPKGALQGNE
jgi:hypothetical protein